MTPVREATPADAAALVEVLARSFTTDPCLSWVFRDEASRTDRLRVLFAGAFEFFSGFAAPWTTDDRDGAALWAPPGAFPLPPDPDGAETAEVVSPFPDEDADRLATFLDTMGEHHPATEHWYLGILGVDPARQGRGIGSACMRPILERCDAEGVPAYLESTNGRNVPLYERHGFWVTDVIDLPEGPSIWTMWREPVTLRP